MLKALVIGHLGKDAALNTLSNGKTVINFSVAHSEKFKDAQGNDKTKTTWVECAYWTERTGILPYLKKGTQVYVEGQPEVKTFAKNDGSTGASFALRVGQVQLLGGNNQQGPTQTADQAASAQQEALNENAEGGYKPVTDEQAKAEGKKGLPF
jgi:single-strand DNA-binding protein